MGVLIRVLPLLCFVGCYDLEFDSSVSNQPPTISILSPTNDATVTSPVRLKATAVDPEDGDISASVVWVEVDVAGGRVGASVDVDLAPGSYTFEARVNDAQGQIATQQVSFTVGEI